MSNKNIMPSDYEDIIYRWTYLALKGVARYIPSSIHPNKISFAAFLSAMTACAFMYFDSSPTGCLYWVIFNLMWYVLDTLDGLHARLSGQTSEFGGFLDHFLDNVFFVFMFTVFTMRFDLLHPLYIFIILMRFTASTVVFLVQHHTRTMYLTKFSGGGEMLLMTAAVLLSYFYPAFDLTQYISVSGLYLEQGVFMKLTLLIYMVGIPINMALMYRFAFRQCKASIN